jgi:hypothetical protein
VHVATNSVSSVTSSARDRVIVAGLVLFALCSSCDNVINQVRVEPGVALRAPVFVLTDTSGRGPAGTIYGVSVVPCGSDTPVWQIAATGTNGAPARITYGETPAGFVVRAGPEPLHAGCYDVFVTDGRRARFRVDAAGRVAIEARRDTVSR